MVNGYFAGFQYCDTTSGSVATPASPRPAARASGAIVCDVTDVFTGLNMSFLSCAASGKAVIAATMTATILVMYFIVMLVSLYVPF